MHSLFHSARLKLTVFYLVIIMIFSLSLSFGIRWYAQREFRRSNLAQRGNIRTLIDRRFGLPIIQNGELATIQDQQEGLLRHHLDDYVILINIGAILVGGALSYWFAGWTLRPIEEAHESQARFAADASHELRTPLATIRTENEVFLRQKSFSKKEAQALISSNLEEVGRLESLASDLLLLTQYEKAALPLSHTSIEEIVQKALEQTEKLRSEKKITINQQLPASKILGHQDSLVQLVSILLDNALKYSPAKSIITLAGIKEDHSYQIKIQDEGPGIDEADLPYIFDRLYRGDKARSSAIPGYGLGLSLAQTIAKANYADLAAGNGPGGGAVFTLVLNC